MAGAAFSPARAERPTASPDIANAAGELLVCGFAGNTVDSPSAQALARQLREGRAGGVVFVKENVGGAADVRGLTALFSTGTPRKPILAIDHEGGAVQRLLAVHGCAVLPPAQEVAKTRSTAAAQALYHEAGQALARLGFNFNLAPVVDLHDARNPAIGHFGRAFSDDPAVVTAYARAFIAGFAAAGIACALKHFPGQGGALADSHTALPDVGRTWSDRDLTPFQGLIQDSQVAAVMSGHSVHDARDRQPAALSRAIVTDLLRTRLGFAGVALTDDLDMGAVGNGYERRSVVRQALRAGNDLLVIRNRSNPDADLPASLAQWIAESVAAGEISLDDLRRSVARVKAFREKVST